jgi:phosphoglycerate dehydrogenase-like enzyme
MDNVVLTPHVAGSTIESAARAHEAAARNVVAVLSGRSFDLRTVVNPQTLEHPSERGRIAR